MATSDSQFAGFDIAAVATEFGAVETPYDDEQLLNEDGESAFEGVRTVETARALLGAAALEAGLASAESDAAAHAAEAASLGALTNVRDGERRRAEETADLRQRELDSLRAVPSSSRLPHAELLSSGGKLLLLAGDTAIIANNLYLRGTELWLALLAGASVATVSIAAGTAAGRECQIAEQRIARGPMADLDTRATRTFFAEDGSDDGLEFARRTERIAFAASLTVGIGVMLLYQDVSLASIGSGLLALITAAGSYFLTRTTTNEVADRIEDVEHQLTDRETKVKAFAALVAAHFEATSAAASAARAGQHRGQAARLTTTVVSDRRPGDPRTFGYADEHATTEDVRISIPNGETSAPIVWPAANGYTNYEAPTKSEPDSDVPGFEAITFR